MLLTLVTTCVTCLANGMELEVTDVLVQSPRATAIPFLLPLSPPYVVQIRAGPFCWFPG
jgi:hypothetical protein